MPPFRATNADVARQSCAAWFKDRPNRANWIVSTVADGFKIIL
jgi:hypothetical protein